MKNQKQKQGETEVPRQLYKFLTVIILSFFLSMPNVVFALGENESPVSQTSQKNNTEYIEHDFHIDKTQVDPIDTSAVKNDVIPDTSKEGKKVIGLFLKTMAGVIFCVIILYVILLFSRKYYFKAFPQNEENEELDNLDLSTPSNRNDALKSFLNRTK